tara:strand:- start:1375 stop:1926 length:552 start_codon:yes stop_codon:yes gene_type:complete
MLYVEKTIPDDCFKLAPKLKSLDRYEIAVFGLDPLHALLLPFRYNRPNTHTFTIFEKETDEIVAIWGAIPVSKTNSQKASIWFLSSNLLEKHIRFFLKGNIKWLNYLEEHYKYCYNFIIEEHKTSIKWLKWQGYTFNDKPTLVKDVKMYYFYKQLDKQAKGIQPIISEIGPKWRTELKDKGQL